MKVKKVKTLSDKKLISFKNGLKILIPYRYNIKVGMKLKFEYERAFLDINKEFVNIFTLSNKTENFDLFINETSEYEDVMNLKSSFVDYGRVNMDKICEKSPIQDLVKALKDDEGYYIGWIANIAMAFQDCYNWEEDKKDIHKISNDAAKHFLKQLGVDGNFNNEEE